MAYATDCEIGHVIALKMMFFKKVLLKAAPC